MGSDLAHPRRPRPGQRLECQPLHQKGGGAPARLAATGYLARPAHPTRMPPPSDRAWQYDLYLLLVVLIWGLNFPILKAVLGVMHPHVVNVFRFLFSLAVLGGVYGWRQHRAGAPFWEPVRQYGWHLFGLGLLGYLLYQFCFIVGVDFTTAGNAALIMASAPLWTALLGHVFGIDRLGVRTWLGLSVTLVGTVLVVLYGAQRVTLSDDAFVGNLMMLGAALFWGSYTVFNKPVLRHVSPAGLTFFGLLMAMPFLVALAVPYVPDVAWEAVDGTVWIAIAYSGALSTGLAIVLWNLGVQRVGPSNTAVYGNLVPVVAVLASVVFLGEQVTPGQLAGGALIILGLVYMRRVRRRTAPIAEAR